jgi:FG-GAP-like repeat
VLGDFNGDALLDVAAADGFSNNVSILLGDGNGNLGSGVLFAGGSTKSAISVDFNGDLLPDIALAAVAPTASTTSPGEVILLLNNTRSASAPVSFGSTP